MSIARHHAEWLSLLEISGPFLSMPVLLRPGVFPHGLDDHDPEVARNVRHAYEEWVDNQQGLRPDPAIHTAWVRFVLRDVLGYPDDLLLSGTAIPETLKATMAEHGETLRPVLVIQRESQKPRVLIQIVRPTQDLDKVLKDHSWKASPATRMAELLRATGVRLGLVTNGERWMLVHAQAGETASYISWYASLWLEERLTLQAFRSLLSVDRTFGVKDSDTLEALLTESASNQQEVTDQLGYQVRQAVEVLVQTLDRIDKDRGRRLLSGVSEATLYEAALTVMMRLVFLFSAEERDLLLLGKPMYDEHYAVSTLRAQLRAAADQTGEEVLERRFDAWSRLLATFRAVFGGVQHEDLRLPAYGGHLFDPDRFPFLEGRAVGTTWRETAARPLAVDNRTVLHLLEALQILRISVPGGGPAEPRRLSFRALDIEQIGHVYEGLLDHTAKRAPEPVLGLVGTKDREPEVPLAELERRAFGAKRKAPVAQMQDMFSEDGNASVPLRDNKELIEFLGEETGRSTSALANALSRSIDTHALDELRVACDNDATLFERVKPFAGLLRGDTFDRPVIITTGSVYVTAGTDRRSSGTHYTPRSLTEPIVQHTLDPLVYHGPAEGLPKEQWKLHAAERILSFKVCDMAMGSGAFLVQTCRYLSERLVEAAEGRMPGGSPNKQLNELFDLQDPDERLAYARRIVADRCLYGVDKNPLAVEIAKLSLWLTTLQKDRPFSFLDHALRCGDSLLGIASIDQLRKWSLDRNTVTNMNFLNDPVRRALDRALHLRRQILTTTVMDVRQAEEKAYQLGKADQAMELMRLAADLLVGAALYSNVKQRDMKRAEFQWRLQILDDAADLIAEGRFTEQGSTSAREAFTALRAEADTVLQGRRPFHWPLEFPEVFDSKDTTSDVNNDDQATFDILLKTVKSGSLPVEYPTRSPGFAAIIGNPPFKNGKLVSTIVGVPYRDYLVEYLAEGKRGSADLCAYFFLRAGDMVGQDGQLGLLATNTIAQGDTREVGLEQLARNDFIIQRAIASRPWPGTAMVMVAHIWLRRGKWSGSYVLDDHPVTGINALLSVSGLSEENVYRLVKNCDKSFNGSYVLGMGFVLTPEEAHALIAKNPKNKDVLFPYLNGEDFNSRADQSPSRWVINFHDWSLERAESYSDCMSIIREKVKPERQRRNERGEFALRKPLPERWWQYADKRPGLYKMIEEMERVLVVAATSRTLAFAFSSTGKVFSHATYVFALDKDSEFALLQSVFHEAWARKYASSMKGDLRYTPSDVFEPFPFPMSLTDLDTIGASYYEHRRQIMLGRQEGLTKIYNRYHDPMETSEDIIKLRQCHVEMDQAVAMAYGWNDLDLDHRLHRTKQGLRYTICEAAWREILDRLLALNHERYAGEIAQGLHDKGAKKAQSMKRKAQPREQATLPGLDETVQPTLDLGEPEQVEPITKEKVIDFQAVARQRSPEKNSEIRSSPPPAVIMPLFGVEEEQLAADLSPADRHVILLARIIQIHREHGYEKTLGHVKAEKISHLVEAHCHADLGRLPIQEAAGPADFRHLLSVIALGKEQGAFYDREREDLHDRNDPLRDFYDPLYPGKKSYEFIALPGFEQVASQMTQAFGSRVPDIEKVIVNLTGLDTNESEVVATLYAIWNDRIATGRNIDNDTLLKEFLNWDESKKRLEGYFVPMIAWMRDRRTNLVPDGTAKLTKPFSRLQRGSESFLAPLSPQEEAHYIKLKGLLKEYRVIKVQTVQERLGIDRNTAQTLIKRLVDEKLARQEQGWEGPQYRLI